MEKLKIAPCWSDFNCPGTLSRYRAEGAGAGGGGRKACIITMHGLSCKELQGRKKAPHSFFSRNHAQDADSVHDKPSSGKEPMHEPWVRKARKVHSEIQLTDEHTMRISS